MYIYISIGPHCHPAGNLKKLNLRKESLPFDWLLCKQLRGFEYVNDLINENFSNFTTNLIYNNEGIVISKNYDYVKFFHHDLLKNKSNCADDIDQNDKILIEVMNKRGKRFMNIISNKENKVIFIYMLKHSYLIKDGLINNNKLFQDMINFDNNSNIKCNFKVLVYLANYSNYLII